MSVLSGTSAGCNEATISDHLAQKGIMAYGQDGTSELTDRNAQRVRILKYLANHPEGVNISNLVHTTVKGVDPTTYHGHFDLSGQSLDTSNQTADRVHTNDGYVSLDGTDPDYQFVRRFIADLEAHTDLVKTASGEAGRHITPTLNLIDLISAGISETVDTSNDLIYDRQFLQNLLKLKQTDLKRLSNAEKELFSSALSSYIQRIENYRLVFEVHLSGRFGPETRRMTKTFATRFNDSGRVNRAFARLQDSLEWGYENAENAVFCTLTTSPRDHDSLYDAIQSISKNFHRLNQFLKSDPNSVADTKLEGVPQWTKERDSSNFHFGREGAVSGRPRKRLEYIKVLEFTSAGYPHLHVLYFDVPTREKDGMPWLLDKPELEHYWSKYGQGKIVDLYPLIYKDNLNDLEESDVNGHQSPENIKFNADEGFVSWYRYGNHNWDANRVEERVRYHQENGQLDFDGADDILMQKTAGSYIGKYISETYSLLTDFKENTADLDNPEETQFWKLGLYWATNKRFWSASRGIIEAIDQNGTDPEIESAVNLCTKISLQYHTEQSHVPHELLDQTDADSETTKSAIHRIVNGHTVQIDYLGTYAIWDMPKPKDHRVQSDIIEELIHDPSEPIQLASRGDRPPPIVEVW